MTGDGSSRRPDADVDLASICPEHGFIGGIVPQADGEVEWTESLSDIPKRAPFVPIDLRANLERHNSNAKC
jgi:hypothetical protein